MGWSLAKLWISYRFTVVQAAYAPSKSTTQDGGRRIEILMCWLSSHPDPLLRLCLRSNIFNVVVPKEYRCKCGGVSNYNRRGSRGLYYEAVWVISVSSCGNLSSLLKPVCRVTAWLHLVVMWLSTHSCPSRGRAVGGHGAVLHSVDMATLSSSPKIISLNINIKQSISKKEMDVTDLGLDLQDRVLEPTPYL